MKKNKFGLGSNIGALALLALVCAMPAIAANGRDFAGLYQYRKLGDVDNQTQVTLSVRLFNYSGADVSGAVVTLEDGLLPGQGYGSIASVTIDDGGATSLSGNFTIPESEYQRWQTGVLPRLYIDYTDRNRSRARRLIELAPAPLGEQP